MKSILLFLMLMSSLFVFYSCSSNDETAPKEEEQPQVSLDKLYPGAAGSEFSYAISVDNVPVGSRIVTLGGTTSIDGKTYTTQNNFVQIGTETTNGTTYYRMRDDTLYFNVDTTGLSALLIESVPASFQSSISVAAPVESKILGVPLNTGKNWSVYGIAIRFASIPINVLDVTGSFVGNEDITLNLVSGNVTKSAKKIQYQMKLRIPDAEFNFRTSIYNAFGWYAEGVGLVRLEGNAAVLQAISSTRITLDDTTRTAVQALNSYNIK